MTITAPTIWIFFPILLGGSLAFVHNRKFLSYFSAMVAVLLALMAQFVPIDKALLIGGISLKISPSFTILGRALTIASTEGALLTLIYGGAALWFFGSLAIYNTTQIAPLGFIIIGLLVASVAVQPFLYAALFIQLAVLISVPMLVSLSQPPGKGVLRFLIYQTLAMPFILMAGWLLAGVEASPGDLALAVQAASMLGLGFAFLLAIFPLYSWIPMLMEDSHPFIVGFLLWILPTMALIFLTGFLDRYSWLRTSPQLVFTLRAAGLLMIVSGGFWAALERHLGRIMAFGVIAETGFSLLALSLNTSAGILILFLLIPARTLTSALWSFGLSVIRNRVKTMRFSDIRGVLYDAPLAGAAIVLAMLSTGAFPLLAGFPPRLALWQNLASVSNSAALWMGIGILGLLMGAIRSLAAMSITEEFIGWSSQESLSQRLILGLGVIGLFILGVFPKSAQFFLSDLPLMFERLGR
ncbi:MAG: hypothetical protein HS124_02470 [Anaerolineales bacterium]|nr:hypothetical protein [Anaerolineales bacterium]MCL4260649.1 hypothetical protein [Anaerolineales bacterium]